MQQTIISQSRSDNVSLARYQPTGEVLGVACVALVTRLRNEAERTTENSTHVDTASKMNSLTRS